MLSGGIEQQSQLRSGHCCTCTVSHEAHPPLGQVVGATALPIMCHSNNGLQQFKVISISITILYAFEPGHRVYHCDELLHLHLACLWQGVPAILVPIAYNSKNGLQQFQSISITYSFGFIKFLPE